MAPFRQHSRFFLVFFLFTICVIGLRAYWIWKALPSTATVLYIDQTTSIKPVQYYPVVTYKTLNETVQTRGTYNLPIVTGQVVNILYNPDDVQEFRINTLYWLWYDIWSWYRLILVAIAMYYIVLFIVKRSHRPATHIYSFQEEERIPADYLSLPANMQDATLEPSADGHSLLVKKSFRVPMIVKALLLLLLPVALFLVGQIWKIPYTRQIAIVIALAYAGMANSFVSNNNDEDPL